MGCIREPGCRLQAHWVQHPALLQHPYRQLCSLHASNLGNSPPYRRDKPRAALTSRKSSLMGLGLSSRTMQSETPSSTHQSFSVPRSPFLSLLTQQPRPAPPNSVSSPLPIASLWSLNSVICQSPFCFRSNRSQVHRILHLLTLNAIPSLI